LGINFDGNTYFSFQIKNPPLNEDLTIFSFFKKDTPYFSPSEKNYMINFKVKNLKELMGILKKEGVLVLEDLQEDENGKFGWIMDPEGNKIELWEPA
ncbi:MAG TPA: VOC family protein, partial [Flavisolibacter sp.]|nr:VOC family protein [Flavisolibacter sp.]